MIKVYTTYGLLTALALIVYFLLLRLIGLHLYPVLSVVNALFFGAGIYFALKKYRSMEKELKFGQGFEVGLFTGGIASVVFTVFMALYMYQIDTEFAKTIMRSWNLETDLGTAMLVIAILIMGIVTTLLLTFSFMQLLKKSWNTPDGNRNIM